MISSDDVAKMVVEVATEKPHTIEGPEAEALYDQLEDECAELRAQGIDIEVPFELPDIENDESIVVEPPVLSAEQAVEQITEKVTEQILSRVQETFDRQPPSVVVNAPVPKGVKKTFIYTEVAGQMRPTGVIEEPIEE